MSSKFFEGIFCISCPSFLVQLKQLNCPGQGTFFEYALLRIWRHQGHLINDVFVHYNGKIVAHLSLAGRDALKESDMADHVFERLAIIKTIHDYTEPSLVFADQFDTAVLDLVVIDDKSPYFCCGQHS